MDNLEGPEEAKRRLKAILDVLSQKKTVEEACATLGIGRARFYQLENEALSGALQGLEPKPPGRPADPAPSEAELEVERLRKRIAELKFEVKSAKVREEVATTIPHVLRNLDHLEKKRAERKRRKPW